MSEIPYRLEVGVEISFDFAERIAAEFLDHRLAKHDGNHRFADYARGRHHTDVGTLVRRFGRFARFQIDRFQRTAQRRDRLEETAHAHVLTVRHAAFESAGAVIAAEEAVLFAVVMNRVLHFRAETFGAFFRPADFHAFDSLHGDDG